jgi:hypothetical protein
MGKPPYPTPAQIQALRAAATLPRPETATAKDRKITITLPAQGLAVLEMH